MAEGKKEESQTEEQPRTRYIHAMDVYFRPDWMTDEQYKQAEAFYERTKWTDAQKGEPGGGMKSGSG